MRANVIEAAEQCGILSIAAVEEPLPLDRFLHARDANSLLVFCDEDAEKGDAIATLQAARQQATAGVDVLIGPEGGFAPAERELLLRQTHVARLSLGPRILRADTAAVAALALVQAVLMPVPDRGSR
jgi:16S rRNA (uracil1498-N3)-methyltransferase